MTFERDRHPEWEELISSSLAGDISEAERLALNAHLDDCAACRATLAAFADQRRIMSGLRHVPPPRDLGARVRAGIERAERRAAPWWKRPPAIFAGVGGGLAVVAGALLALVLLDAPGQQPPVGQASPSAAASVAPIETPAPTDGMVQTPAPAPIPTLPPPQTPAPSSAEQTPAPASEPPLPSLPSSTASPEPDGYLAVTGPIESPSLSVYDGETDEPVTALQPPPETVTAAALPVAAELSPGGDWLAFIAEIGGSGAHELRVTRIGDALAAADGDEASPGPEPVESSVEVGETILVGPTVADSPFLERMSWSSDGRYLAVTLADPATEAVDADVWIFDATDGSVHRLTDSGVAFAGSFVPAADTPTARLWVSAASEEPRSHLVELGEDVGNEPVDPAEVGTHEVAGFQPLVSPNGAFVIYWAGRMAPGTDRSWVLSEAGQPVLAEHRLDDPEVFPNARPLFGDLVVERDGFSDAALAWSPNSDAYAVWNARWTGIPQGEDYPDERRVYFGRATDPRGLTRVHAIDAGDLPADASVVDVKLSPTGRHLAITARRPSGGVLDAPAADLLLVTRNTGEVADEVEVIGSGDDGWFGPAVFDETAWETLIGP